MTLLICPVRPGDDNPELRYALRSWQTNLVVPDMYLMVIAALSVGGAALVAGLIMILNSN